MTLQIKTTGHYRALRRQHPALYKRWWNMIVRCHDPDNDNYTNYGAVGIQVSVDWWDFRNWLKDLADLFKPGYEMDRINPTGNYCKDNVQVIEQRLNRIKTRKRTNTSSEYLGVSKSNSKENPWRARMHIDNIELGLGFFRTEEEAAKVYTEIAEEWFGAYAKYTTGSVKGRA